MDNFLKQGDLMWYIAFCMNSLFTISLYKDKKFAGKIRKVEKY